MIKKAKKVSKAEASSKRDDFESIARRLGADEDKAQFEEKLRKIAKSKPAVAR